MVLVLANEECIGWVFILWYLSNATDFDQLSIVQFQAVDIERSGMWVSSGFKTDFDQHLLQDIAHLRIAM